MTKEEATTVKVGDMIMVVHRDSEGQHIPRYDKVISIMYWKQDKTKPWAFVCRDVGPRGYLVCSLADQTLVYDPMVSLKLSELVEALRQQVRRVGC